MGETTGTAAISPRGYKRRQYVVNSTFQWKYTLTVAVVVFLISSLLSVVLYGILHNQARLRMLDPATYKANVGAVIVFAAVAFSALCAAGVGFWCMIVTHRVCGPLYVMERWMKELIKGRFPALRPLREKDEFKHFYEVFAKAVGALRAKREAELSALTAALDLARSGGDSDEDGCRTTLAALTTQIEAMRDSAAGDLELDVEALSIAPGTGSTSTPMAVTAG